VSSNKKWLTPKKEKLFFLDDPAGDAAAAIAGRITLLVVGAGVDDQGSAVTCEQRSWPGRQSHAVIGDVHLTFSILAYHEVWHVPGMRSGRVIEAMMLAQRVVMLSRRCERRPGTVPLFMDVDAVRARRQAAHINVYVDKSVGIFIEGGHTDLCPIRIFQDRSGIVSDTVMSTGSSGKHQHC
jgi:hypothetical protein